MRPSRSANSLSATVEAVPSRLPKPFFMTWTIPKAPCWDHTGSLGSVSSVRKLRPTYSLRRTHKNPETRAISGFVHSTAPPRVTHSSPQQLVAMALMPLRTVDSRLWSKGWFNSPTKMHNWLLYGLLPNSNVWTSGRGPPTAFAIDSRRKSSPTFTKYWNIAISLADNLADMNRAGSCLLARVGPHGAWHRRRDDDQRDLAEATVLDSGVLGVRSFDSQVRLCPF